MNTLKIKKAPILFPLLLLAVVLAAYTVLNFQSVSAADSLSLGQQQLNDLNYGGAVASFTQAIELDPSNLDARIGLAEAYGGTQEYDFAQQVLEEVVFTEQPDEAATKAMIDLMRQGGQTHQAVVLTHTLIESTDKEDYYTLRGELLEDLYSTKRSLALGYDHQLMIRNGQVYARGSNNMGQLGLDPAAVAAADQYVSAQFPGTAMKVACVGRTSFVVDDAGALWAAGEARWGQTGEGFALMSSRSGWQRIPCDGPVADVAGTAGRLLVLLTDGTLLSAGAGTTQTLQPLEQFFPVIALDATQDQAVILTAGGRLHSSGLSAPEQWTLVSRDVSSFTLSDDTICWVGRLNQLNSQFYSFSVPDTWYAENGGITADLAISHLAYADGLVLITAAGGRLYQLPGDGSLQEISCSSPVTAMYPRGVGIVLEHEDGSAQYWSADSLSPIPLEQL